MVHSKKGSSKKNDEPDYKAMKVDELKTLLTERGLKPKGIKRDLVRMLEKSDRELAKEVEEEVEVDEEEVEVSDDAESEEEEDEEPEEEEVEVSDDAESEEEPEEEVEDEEPEEAEVESEEEAEEENSRESQEEVEEEVKPKKAKSSKIVVKEKTSKAPKKEVKPTTKITKESPKKEEKTTKTEVKEKTKAPKEPPKTTKPEVKEKAKTIKAPKETPKKEEKSEKVKASKSPKESPKETPKKSFKVSSSKTSSPVPSQVEQIDEDDEGLFGTIGVVKDKLCENRKALEVFSPKPEHEFQKFMVDVYRSKDYDSLKKVIKNFAAFGECDLGPKFTSIYKKWLDEIADYFLDLLKIDSGVLEPRFDSSLGVYVIGNYVFQQDPENSTALVYAYVKDQKVVPLTDKNVKECPKEYTLYHIYHRQPKPPMEEAIKKIMGDTPYPRLPPMIAEVEAEEDGISYPSKEMGSEKAVAGDLAEITIPEPTKSAFLAYRAAQRKFKTANYKTIADRAGISEDDALYIASHFKMMEDKYRS